MTKELKTGATPSRQTPSPAESKEEAIGFSTHLLHSSTVTPPIPKEKKLKFVAMSQMGDDTLKSMVTLDANEPFEYDGLYTGGLTECVAITIAERNSQGKIMRLSMIHWDGGLSINRLNILIKNIDGRQLPEGGYREIIVAGGSLDSNDDIKDFKNRFLSSIDNEDIDSYLKSPKNLHFKKCKYTFTPGTGSACVTFDGYAGPFYGIFDSLTPTNIKGTFDSKSIEDERIEFEKFKHELDAKAIDRVKKAIDAAGCDDETRAQLYFYTREIIFKTKFNPDVIPSNDPNQKSINEKIIDKALQDYKIKINKLQLTTKKEIIISAVVSCILVSIPFVFIYHVFSRKWRSDARKTLENELTFQEQKNLPK